MRGTPNRFLLTATVVAALALPAPDGFSATRSPKAPLQFQDGKALIYLIREDHFTASARTMFLYSDREFLGALDNDCYTSAWLEPGSHLLWLNWAKVNHQIQVEAEKVYYVRVWDNFLELDPEEGQRLIDESDSYCTPNEREARTASKQIEKRYEKALQYAERETGEFASGRERLERHAAEWPAVDLSRYDTLYIADFEITDPKAAKRKRREVVESAPERIADLVKQDLDAGLFEEVRREPPVGPAIGSVVLEVKLTKYKPGSDVHGVNAFHTPGGLDFTARLIDGRTGEVLTRFTGERSWGRGTIFSDNVAIGIEGLEQNVAYELSLYLEHCKEYVPGLEP